MKTDVSALLMMINDNEARIRTSKNKIKVYQNDILVATSDWEKVDVHIWNGSEYKREFSLRFSKTTGKERFMKFVSHTEFYYSDFYVEYIENSVAGVDFIDVNFQ